MPQFVGFWGPLDLKRVKDVSWRWWQSKILAPLLNLPFPALPLYYHSLHPHIQSGFIY